MLVGALPKSLNAVADSLSQRSRIPLPRRVPAPRPQRSRPFASRTDSAVPLDSQTCILPAARFQGRSCEAFLTFCSWRCCSPRVAGRALIIRTLGGRSVNATSNRRSCSEYPTMISRGSSDECSGSSKILAIGSPNTVAASSKVTPCLRPFSLAFAGSHSNSRLIGRLPRGYHERFLVAIQSKRGYREKPPARPRAVKCIRGWFASPATPELARSILLKANSNAGSQAQATRSVSDGEIDAFDGCSPCCTRLAGR